MCTANFERRVDFAAVVLDRSTNVYTARKDGKAQSGNLFCIAHRAVDDHACDTSHLAG
jgi:propanediol dehydratase small subunit